MILLPFFNISTGFRFTKNQCECSVHILRRPWLIPTLGLVLMGISTVVGCLAVCNAGISISGGTDVAYANQDILEDSTDAGVVADEPPVLEVDQETVGVQELCT